MSNLHICLGYAGRATEFQDDSSYQEAYKSVYKPLGAILFANPQLKFSFFFTGPQIEYFKKKNPEFLDLIKNLIARKQVEVIGGGYYNPLFPLILPADRAAQIEKLTLSLRQNFGKRPRGVYLFCDSWDPSLISTFDATNLEYAFLDSSLLQPGKDFLIPIVMNNLGKSIVILPIESDLAPQKGQSAKNYFSRVIEAFESAKKNDKQNEQASRILSFFFDKDSILSFLDEKWREDFDALVQGKEECDFSLPYNCVKEAESLLQTFVHSGINKKIARWCITPYESVEPLNKYPVNIYDYLQTYKSSLSLFDRMMNVSMLVNQCHGDKMRKNAARDRLLAAQSGEAYVCRSSNELASFTERQNAYKNLMEAERLVRECSSFKESVTSYDYNGDGFNEYICRLEKCNVCVGTSGGSIFELDVLKSNGNYADNLSRAKKYDGLDDNYFRGIFVDHLFEDAEAQKYCKGEPCRNGMFSAKRYKEVLFSSPRQEIHFETKTKFSTLDQPISLKKNYIVKSNGITVQYILKNEGPITVQGKFAVESNFAELDLLNPNYKPYSIEIVTGQNIVIGTSDNYCRQTVQDGLIQKASALQITDSNSNVSFMFTPNEEAGVTFFPVTFKRRNMDTDILQNESRTFVTAFIWDVDLAASMEIEKTINLTITQTRKRRK
ncbi:MAG: DUF1926 domain-containing protein [Treponema sp.]|nr:DUF1926 domain-containing protein [Treponema sp.]